MCGLESWALHGYHWYRPFQERLRAFALTFHTVCYLDVVKVETVWERNTGERLNVILFLLLKRCIGHREGKVGGFGRKGGVGVEV